jgi:hypothetical protein
MTWFKDRFYLKFGKTNPPQIIRHLVSFTLKVNNN